MTNSEIVKLLRNMAAALTIQGANRFRIIAYEKAADSIEHLTSDTKDVWDEGKLNEIPGVGPTIAGHLDELFRTGHVKHFESTFKGLSPAVFTFLEIPGIGPKRAFQLTQKFKLNDPKTAVARLEQIAKSGKIAQLPGWGEKSQTEILSAIETYKRGQIKENRMPLPYADLLAQELIEYLAKIPGVKRVDCLGSLRRKVATIGDVDLAAATTDPQKVLHAFVTHPKVRKIVDQGEKGATVLLSVGRQVDLRVQAPSAYGAMLQYFTGSKHHNIRLREYALKKGLSLSEHGIKTIGKTKNPQLTKSNYNSTNERYEFDNEKDFYQALGMDWIDPELREDNGEIEAALSHRLPKLVMHDDIKGDLHVHSNYDLSPSHDLGSSTLTELLDRAVELGYEYLGISDHNPSTSKHTEKQVVEIMKKRRERFEKIHSAWSRSVKKRVHLFTMLEVDIDPKGNLALPDGAFAYVDAVVASVHSVFNQSKEQMTERILKALQQPKVKILGHPTGRLLGSREGIEADWKRIFGFCSGRNIAMEINSWPERLDLPNLLVREALQHKIKLVIDTDSHDDKNMNLMPYGVDVARRGWAEKQDILNTLGYNDFRSWLLS